MHHLADRATGGWDRATRGASRVALVERLTYTFDGQLRLGQVARVEPGELWRPPRILTLDERDDLAQRYSWARRKLRHPDQLARFLAWWRPFLFDSYYAVSNLALADQARLLRSMGGGEPPRDLWSCCGLFLPMVFLHLSLMAEHLQVPVNIALVQAINGDALLWLDQQFLVPRHWLLERTDPLLHHGWEAAAI